MGQYQHQTTGLLRGLNENEDPHALKPGELVVADNAARYGTMVGTRLGTVRPGTGEDYENAIDEAKPIQGIFEWRADRDATRKLLVLTEHTDHAAGGAGGADGCIVSYQDNARFGAGGVITAGADNLWHMTEHNDLVWAAGGGATDSFWHLDPSNVANTPTALALPVSTGTAYPKYVISWRNYLLANGFRGGVTAENNPAATRFCTLGADPTSTAGWAVGNTVGFDAFGDNYTTGFGTYRDNAGDYLIILGNKKLQAVVLNPLNAFQITDAVENGCVSQRAYVSLGLDSGEAVYLSDKGIHSLRQSQEFGAKADTFLSWKIPVTMASLNRSRLEHVVGAYDHINGWVLFAVPTGSNAYNDTILCLDVKTSEPLTADTANWYVWHMAGGIRIQDMQFLRDGTSANDWKLMIATTNGDILYLSADTFSDIQVDGATDTTYTAEIQTAHNDYGSTLMAKRIGDVMISIRPGGRYTPQFQVIFDYGARVGSTKKINMQKLGSDKWGSATWGAAVWSEASHTRDDKIYATGHGRTIGFRIYHSGGNEPWRVSKIDHQIMLIGEDTGDVAST